MRIFLAGDAVTGTGPANVTKYYIENLPAGTLYQRRRNKVLRAFEILMCTLRADVVVYSGYSKQNILGLRMAKLFGKPSAYIMHGCVEYENEINREPDVKMNAVERATLEMCDLVIAVSERFATWLKEYYPMHADKIDHVTNGLDISLLNRNSGSSERDPHMIFTVWAGCRERRSSMSVKR